MYIFFMNNYVLYREQYIECHGLNKHTDFDLIFVYFVGDIDYKIKDNT